VEDDKENNNSSTAHGGSEKDIKSTGRSTSSQFHLSKARSLGGALSEITNFSANAE